MNIYDSIKLMTSKKGLTLAQLADRLGVTRQSLNTTMKSPSYPSLEKIADALEVPMWQLFASPEEVKGDDFLAMVRFGGQYYHADSVDELERLISLWRQS